MMMTSWVSRGRCVAICVFVVVLLILMVAVTCTIAISPRYVQYVGEITYGSLGDLRYGRAGNTSFLEYKEGRVHRTLRRDKSCAHNLFVLSSDDARRLGSTEPLAIGGLYDPRKRNNDGIFLLRLDAYKVDWVRVRKLVDGAHPGCVERRPAFNGLCEFDGQPCMVWFAERWWLYARANLSARGGYRAVQVASSVDGKTFGPFEPMQIEEHDAVNDIHYAQVYRAPGGGQLTAVLPICYGETGGIYVSTSTDGVHFTRPRALLACAAHQRRTAHIPCAALRWHSDGCSFSVLVHENAPRRVPNSGEEAFIWHEWRCPNGGADAEP
jgi:hypothetical protein